jgi:hypothetical protein
MEDFRDCEPELILPTQFRDLRTSVERAPAIKLCAALLDNCIADLKGRREDWRAEARRWIEGAPSPISFDMVCAALGFEPTCLGPALLRLTDGCRVKLAKRHISSGPRKLRLNYLGRRSRAAEAMLAV